MAAMPVPPRIVLLPPNSEDRVVTLPADQQIIAGCGSNDAVVTHAAIDRVGTSPERDGVVALVTEQDARRTTDRDDVVP